MPQATGANPFRQSMLFPHTTGIPSSGFGLPQQQPPPQFQVPTQTVAINPFPGAASGFGGQQSLSNTNPFPTANSQQAQAPATNPFPSFASFASNTSGFVNNAPSSAQPHPANSLNPFPSFATAQPVVASPFAQNANANAPPHVPTRSASVPLTSVAPPEPSPLKTHQTGSRNPFGVPVAPAPPVPKVPTLMELALGKTSPHQGEANGGAPSGGLKPNMTGFGAASSTNGSVIASVASEFALSRNNNNAQIAKSTINTSFPPFSSSLQQSTSPTATGSTATSHSLFSPMSTQPTGVTSVSSPLSPLQPQSTGYSGIKPFKPSSSFGAALLESLPSIPQSAPTTPNIESIKPMSTSALSNGSSLSSQPTGILNGGSFLNSNPTGFGIGAGSGTGSTVGVGLRPQTTGLAGAANPFRATMFSLPPGSSGNAFGGGLNSTPTGNAFGTIGGGFGPMATGLQNQFGGPFGSSASAPLSLNPQQQQQNGQTSLI